MRRSLLVFFLGICSLLVSAQQSGYTLLYYKGKVELVSTKGIAATVSKTGAIVQTGMMVKTTEQAEAVFRNATGDIVYLNKPGTYAVKDFGKLKTPKPQDFSSYYMKYIANQLTHHEEKAENNYRENLRNTGGVSRGNYQHCVVNVSTFLMPDDTITFNWKNFGDGIYTFSIYEDSLLSSEKFSDRIKDTVFAISPAMLDTGKFYWWSVSAKDQPKCDFRAFKILSQTDAAAIKQEYKELKKELVYTPAMNKVIEATFYQGKGLFENARLCYRQACLLEPENKVLLGFEATFLASL